MGGAWRPFASPRTTHGAVEVQVSHPAGLAGEVKLVTPITMENIADAELFGSVGNPC